MRPLLSPVSWITTRVFVGALLLALRPGDRAASLLHPGLLPWLPQSPRVGGWRKSSRHHRQPAGYTATPGGYWAPLHGDPRGLLWGPWFQHDCSHEIKRRLLLGRKVMTNLDSMFKSRDITLPTKVHLVKAMVFPVVMYGCESWTVKKAERGRIDAFELWCWRRLLRVPWTARRSNQFILKEISPECSLEGLMLKLKLQYWLPDAKS